MRAPLVLTGAALAALLALLPDAARAQGTGSVRGRVVEQGVNTPVPGTQVFVTTDAGRLGAVSENNGSYVIRNVPAGQVVVRALRLGYRADSAIVTVPAGGEVVADFTLVRAATQLATVVTTATGEQSRREVGNVIATVSVDSLTGRIPVTNVTEVMQARTPGVQIIQAVGTTGSSPSIRIRGTSSLSLNNEPLIIIDGIRVDNSAQQGTIGGSPQTSRVNRFSAFNADDIEAIDIIKGPSAAALYGTAAANGVVIIKTRRGAAGRTKWNVYGEVGQVSQPAEFFDNYRSWGRNLVNGAPSGNPTLCRISDKALGRCQVDSLTTFNPLMNGETTPFAEQPRYLFGAQVSGGNSNFTYFLSAEREQETGPFEMPSAEIDRLTTLRGSKPREEQIEPNSLEQTSFRGNFGVPLGSTAQVSVSTGYLDRTMFDPFAGGFFAGLWFQTYFAPGFRTPTNGTSAQHIGDIFSVTQKLRDQRLTGSSSLNWQTTDWLTTRATIGIDQNNNYGIRFARFGEGTITGWGPPGQTGGRDATRAVITRYSADVGATADWQARSWLSTRTSVGLQWFKDASYQTDARGYSLPPGAQTPQGAQQQLSSETTIENATYGAFLEEVLGWDEKRFLTLGIRTDQNSAFGTDVGNTLYPRAAISWVLSQESWFPGALGWANDVRVRAAYGSAGQFPTVTTASLQFLTPFTVPIGGGEQAALRLQSLGNPDLKPEVTSEFEVGTDLGLFNSRMMIEFTYYNKQSKDALFLNPLPPSYGTQQTGAPSQWQNLAKVRNSGFELAVEGTIVQSRNFTWSARLNGSTVENELVDRGTAQLAVTQGARNVEGYPLFGLWARPIRSYTDANGDGIIVEDEVVVGDTAEYKGPTLPTREAGFTTTLGFFNNALRVNALLDYRGGFYNQWGFENQRCISGNCAATNLPTAPLKDQAAAVTTTSARLGNSVWGFFEPNDFIRFREISVAYTIPTRLTSQARMRDVTVALSGRNIGVLWSKFPGIDPEINAAAANTGGGNNDFFAAPPLQYWILRFIFGL